MAVEGPSLSVKSPDRARFAPQRVFDRETPQGRVFIAHRRNVRQLGQVLFDNREVQSVRSSAPKRRLDVSRSAPIRAMGKRVATRKRRLKRRLLPTPAVAGALALILAGVGSVASSSKSDSNPLSGNYQTFSASYTGDDSGSSTTVDVSRDFDRGLLERQVNEQAKQQQKALNELAAKTQKRAKELELNQWVLPVAGYRLTGRFGQRSSLWSTFHTGLDFAGPSGSTIVSVATGTVKSTGYNGAYGNRTIIALPDGTDIWYCHQSRIVVKAGDKIGPGDIVGYTGATGNVTGPHLHLEVHPDGGPAVDPEIALPQHGVNP